LLDVDAAIKDKAAARARVLGRVEFELAAVIFDIRACCPASRASREVVARWPGGEMWHIEKEKKKKTRSENRGVFFSRPPTSKGNSKRPGLLDPFTPRGEANEMLEKGAADTSFHLFRESEDEKEAEQQQQGKRERPQQQQQEQLCFPLSSSSAFLHTSTSTSSTLF